jgi:hypothetical protein
MQSLKRNWRLLFVMGFKDHKFYNTFETYKGWKHEIRSHIVCGQSLKTIFQIFENLLWEHYIFKNSLKFWNKFLNFQIAITKFSWKFIVFEKFFSMFKVLKKSTWTCGFFGFKNLFSLSNVHQIISIFFLNFNIFPKKGSKCSKHSKNKKHIYLFKILMFKHP